MTSQTSIHENWTISKEDKVRENILYLFISDLWGCKANVDCYHRSFLWMMDSLMYPVHYRNHHHNLEQLLQLCAYARSAQRLTDPSSKERHMLDMWLKEQEKSLKRHAKGIRSLGEIDLRKSLSIRIWDILGGSASSSYTSIFFNMLVEILPPKSSRRFLLSIHRQLNCFERDLGKGRIESKSEATQALLEFKNYVEKLVDFKKNNKPTE